MTDEIIKKVLDIVVEETGLPSDQVTIESTFVDLGVDSLDFLCILSEVRKNVGPISDNFISQIEKVGDLAAAVWAKA